MQAADEEKNMNVYLLNYAIRKNEMREINYKLKIEAANFEVYVILWWGWMHRLSVRLSCEEGICSESLKQPN
jgi:hypothetical protein